MNQLSSLSSKYNIETFPSDKKYYKKYNYKLTIKFWRSNIFSNAEFFKLLSDIRSYADGWGDRVRVESLRAQYYTNDVDTLGNIIEEFKLAENNQLMELYYFPTELPSSVRLRRSPVKHPWEVVVKNHAPIAALSSFYKSYVDIGVHLNKSGKWDLDIEQSGSKFGGTRRKNTKTYGYTNWRFDDESLKNMFILAFSEHVKEEIFYQHQPING